MLNICRDTNYHQTSWVHYSLVYLFDFKIEIVLFYYINGDWNDGEFVD